MNKDNKLIMEALQSKFTGRGPVNDIVVSELHKMHNNLNDMATMIDLNPSAEVDQLLSKIRDVADMLIAERPAENAESADERKERVQRGWDLNKKRWAKWKMENPEAAAKHAAKKAKSEDAENEPHGYPQGMTAIQNLLLNELKKRGFELTKISHADKERDKYPTVFMMRSEGPMHNVVEIDGMGAINGEPYKEYLANLKDGSEDAEGAVKQPYNAMMHLTQAANEIRDILKSHADDEAQVEHIIRMAQIILGPKSDHTDAEYRKMLDGLIVILNRFIIVPMN